MCVKDRGWVVSTVCMHVFLHTHTHTHTHSHTWTCPQRQPALCLQPNRSWLRESRGWGRCAAEQRVCCVKFSRGIFPACEMGQDLQKTSKTATWKDSCSREISHHFYSVYNHRDYLWPQKRRHILNAFPSRLSCSVLCAAMWSCLSPAPWFHVWLFGEQRGSCARPLLLWLHRLCYKRLSWNGGTQHYVTRVFIKDLCVQVCPWIYAHIHTHAHTCVVTRIQPSGQQVHHLTSLLCN